MMTAGRFWLMSGIAACLLFATEGSETAGLTFVKSPQPIVAPPGDRVVFECETNVPAERIVWLHNGVDLAAGYNQSLTGKRKGRAADDEAASYRMREVDGPSKSGLHLILRIHKNPQRYRQQAGDYQCVAWFGAVALTSLPAKLTIAVLGVFPAMPAPFSSFFESESSSPTGPGRATLRDGTSGLSASVYALEVFAGETAVLPCPPPPSDPPATITFFKDGKPLALTDRIRMMASGNVHVTDALTSDSGQYTCSAYNYITGESIESRRVVRLGVKTGPSRARSVVLTWQPAEKTIAQLGQNVTIECAATGWPRPQIRWFRDANRPLPVGRSLYIDNGALVVTQLEYDDEGAYICEASNGVGPNVRVSTTLELTEPVSIVRPPQDARVEEGGSVSFDCLAKGRPAPSFYWMFNGNLLTNDSLIAINDHQLVISNVTKKHAGIFQCFVFSSLSKVDGGAATLEVIPRQKVGSSPSLLSSSDSSFSAFNEEEDDDFDADDSFDPTPPTQPPRQDKKGKKNRHRAKEMIPPTKPNVTRLSDESVMVHWSVPQNEGLPIEFFKVQFKEADKSGSRWKTIDEDIPSHIRSYEVSGLKAGLTYRFRIAAVYTNNDNKLGPTSAKFVLEKEPPKKKPAHVPFIEKAQAESPSAVNIYWKYPDLDSVPIDGFFIYYRSTTSAGEYAKVTVLGGLTRSHIVTHLLPDTHYDLKMQAFNMQGTSDFSRITTVKTKSAEIYKPSPPLSANSRPRGYRPLDDVQNSVGPLDVVSSDTKVTNDMLYIIVGAVLGGLSVIVVLLVAICQCRSRSSERDRERAVWDNINGMSGLNGKAIVRENGNTIVSSNHHHVHPYSHHHLHSAQKIHNGYLDQHRPLYVESSSHDPDETAETSFCDGTHRSSGDLLRSTDSLSRHSLKRNYARNGSIPSLPVQHPPSSHPMMSRPRTVDANTLPLLQRRDQCLNDADWEAAVPPADSEKFI